MRNNNLTFSVKTLEVNEIGRDFVCGDLHGAFERVEQFLEHVRFDVTRDRLISVGDLVDRGPDNELCLRLIEQPWFYAVQGNHEQLMSQYYDPSLGPYGDYWSYNGGMWGIRYHKEQSDEAYEIRQLAKKTTELPLLITVPMKDGRKFHVLHAELSSINELSDADLENEEKFKEAAFQQTMDGDFIVWGRFIFYSLYKQQLNEGAKAKYLRTADMHKFDRMFGPNLSHIYSGHTIMQRPVRFKGQTNIDTCAYGSTTPSAVDWMGLTVTEPLSDKFWHVSGAGVKEVEPFVVE
jgi:hypothetical protein